MRWQLYRAGKFTRHSCTLLYCDYMTSLVRYFRVLRFTSTNHAIMESDIEENRRRQMEEIEALSSIYEENFTLGNMI